MKSAGDEHGQACYVQHPVGLRTPHLLIGLWKGLISRVVLVSACCATTPRPEIHAKAHVSLNTQAGPKPTSLSTHRYAQSPRLTQHTSRPKAHVSLNSQIDPKPTSHLTHKQAQSPRLSQLTSRLKAHVSLNSQTAQKPKSNSINTQAGPNLTSQSFNTPVGPKAHVSLNSQPKAHDPVNSQTGQRPTSISAHKQAQSPRLQIRHISSIRHLLTIQATQTLVLSRLHCYNSTFRLPSVLTEQILNSSECNSKVSVQSC